MQHRLRHETHSNMHIQHILMNRSLSQWFRPNLALFNFVPPDMQLITVQRYNCNTITTKSSRWKIVQLIFWVHNRHLFTIGFSWVGSKASCISRMGWRIVPKHCVPVQMFLDPWSQNQLSIVTQCPWIYSSLSLCIIQYVLFGANWQGCINAGTLCFRDDSSREPRVPEHSHGDTLFRDVPSPHHFKKKDQVITTFTKFPLGQCSSLYRCSLGMREIDGHKVMETLNRKPKRGENRCGCGE